MLRYMRSETRFIVLRKKKCQSLNIFSSYVNSGRNLIIINTCWGHIKFQKLPEDECVYDFLAGLNIEYNPIRFKYSIKILFPFENKFMPMFSRK